MNKELKPLVVMEARNLKVHATQEERAKLDFEELHPDSAYSCIYGQMTGDCHTPRALRLLELCARPYSDSIRRYSKSANLSYNYEQIRAIPTRSYSPIEFYITMPFAENKTLIDFIKGGRDTLTIEDL